MLVVRSEREHGVLLLLVDLSVARGQLLGALGGGGGHCSGGHSGGGGGQGVGSGGSLGEELVEVAAGHTLLSTVGLGGRLYK